MAISEAIHESGAGVQSRAVVRAYARVIESGGYTPPSEGSWAYIGQSGNVLYGFREEGRIIDVGSVTPELIGTKFPDLAERIADDSMDMIYGVGEGRIKLRTFVEQQEILKAISQVLVTEVMKEGE